MDESTKQLLLDCIADLIRKPMGHGQRVAVYRKMEAAILGGEPSEITTESDEPEVEE